jgi:hypothetical protein
MLEEIQGGITEIIEVIGGGGAGNGGNGGVGGNGNGNGNGHGGCNICINCGCGPCCCNGEDCCDPDPPVDPPGGNGDPDPLCLIGAQGIDINDGDLIELWFTAEYKSCTKDFYFGSSSINWLGDNACTPDVLTGFHGQTPLGGEPGAGEVTQAVMYAKR